MEDEINRQEGDRLVQRSDISEKFSPKKSNCFNFELNTRWVKANIFLEIFIYFCLQVLQNFLHVSSLNKCNFINWFSIELASNRKEIIVTRFKFFLDHELMYNKLLFLWLYILLNLWFEVSEHRRINICFIIPDIKGQSLFSFLIVIKEKTVKP